MTLSKKNELFSPKLIKLNSSVSKGLSTSKEKQELITLFLEFIPNTTKFILGRIETKEDYTAAKQLRIPIYKRILFLI